MLPLDNNEFLDSLEKTKEYKTFYTTTKKALKEQWEDIVYSGAIVKLYDYLNPIFRERDKRKEQNKKQKVQKASTNRQKINRLILSGKVGSLAKLEFRRYVEDGITGGLKTVGGYGGYDQKVRDYLLWAMNKGGQKELDAYLGTDKLKFSLSKEYYRIQLRKRIKKLIKGLDEVTKSKISKQLILGLDKGETKKQLIDRLLKKGNDLSETRAKRIVETETAAAVEYMRHETAKLNGVRKKRWVAVLDERTGDLDRQLHGKTAKIGDAFEGTGVKHPPLHTNCRCTLDYDYVEALCSNTNQPLRKAKGKAYEFYDLSEDNPACANPNAVWAGGSSLVGVDKLLGLYVANLLLNTEQRRKAWNTFNTDFLVLDEQAIILEEARDLGGSKVLTDPEKARATFSELPVGDQLKVQSLSTEELLFAQARVRLSDEGFVQLSRQLGYRRYIPPRKK